METTTIRVGKMPGRISEFAVAKETSIKEVLELAGLDASGHDIKVDGKVASLNDTVGDANLIILAQMVKGNSDKIVRVGKMPGRIIEVAVASNTKISEVLEFAELDASGFDIKADGKVVRLEDEVGEANLIILAQQVKGNK